LPASKQPKRKSSNDTATNPATKQAKRTADDDVITPASKHTQPMVEPSDISNDVTTPTTNIKQAKPTSTSKQPSPSPMMTTKPVNHMFACNICHETFGIQQQLAAHMRSHSKSKPSHSKGSSQRNSRVASRASTPVAERNHSPAQPKASVEARNNTPSASKVSFWDVCLEICCLHHLSPLVSPCNFVTKAFCADAWVAGSSRPTSPIH
jgi:hypothetical protein